MNYMRCGLAGWPISAKKLLNWTAKVGHLSDDLAEWRGFIRSMNDRGVENC